VSGFHACAAGAATDVTERRRVARCMKSSEARSQAIAGFFDGPTTQSRSVRFSVGSPLVRGKNSPAGKTNRVPSAAPNARGEDSTHGERDIGLGGLSEAPCLRELED